MTTVRPATPQDAEAVALVYGDGIRAGTATVVRRPPGVDVLRERITATRPHHTWLVAEDDGTVVGWAATMPFAAAEEYDGVAEFSVYVATAHHGRGTGRQLMTALLDAAEQAGLHKLTSRVFAANAASRALLAGLGFREVGTYERHARGPEGWRDVVVVEVLLGEARLA